AEASEARSRTAHVGDGHAPGRHALPATDHQNEHAPSLAQPAGTDNSHSPTPSAPGRPLPITPAKGTARTPQGMGRRLPGGSGESMSGRASTQSRRRRLYVASGFASSVVLVYLLGLLSLVAIVPMAAVALMGAGI